MENVFLLGGCILSVGAWGLAATVSFAPIKTGSVLAKDPHLVSPDENLLTSYELCSESAEFRVLSRAEAESCSEDYLKLKLSFLPGVELDQFRSLPAAEQWEIQQRAYFALLEWREREAHKAFSSLQ